MPKSSPKKFWPVLIGVVLIILGLAGYFTDPARSQSPDSLVDNPAQAGAIEEVIPNIVTPTPGGGQAGEPQFAPSPSPFQPGGPQSTQLSPGDDNSYLVPINPGLAAGAQPTSAAGTSTGLKSSSQTIVAKGLVPERIVIPAIHLDAPVVPSHYWVIKVDNQLFQQWLAPDKFAAGWMATSATLGQPGNTVLSGHHNVFGEVFRYLVDLSVGDTIQLYSGNMLFTYQITNKMILPERDEPISVRLENARWLLPSTDERLTLITCWPYVSNTHRLIIVARPISHLTISDQGTNKR